MLTRLIDKFDFLDYLNRSAPLPKSSKAMKNP